MNIVVLVIDTLRYDCCGCHGSTGIRTPNIDRLAERAMVFDRSFTCSYPTIPHRTDVITGRCGAPFHPWLPLKHNEPTFLDGLKDAGYAAQLIHDTPHMVNGGHNFDWPFHAWTFVRGGEVDRPWIDDSREWPENWGTDPVFDFVEQNPFENRVVVTYSRANRRRVKEEDWNAAQLFSTASAFLRDNASRDNFFLWIDCFDPHEPWDAPADIVKTYDTDPDFDGKLDPRSIIVRRDMPEPAVRRIENFFKAKVTLVDKWLGRFLDTLEETGLDRNTALILTADHGTNLYEYGFFSKSYPITESEGHTPFIVAAPEGAAGRSDMIVQPMDVYAVIAGLAGIDVPENVESFDCYSMAAEGKTGERRVALSGRRANGFPEHPLLFTVFDREWCLQWAFDTADCTLRKLGSTEDVSSEHPDTVEELHTAGLAELKKRGMDPEIEAWLDAQGTIPFPENAQVSDTWPGPDGYRAYFERLYLGK